ncbi:MAG: ImmA/IrrE family metallo-endopeptidase [Actinomycetales bacterium]|nr:ImmA/IrrE family metallo-endopeptidase [Actinomycetales bacterium]
MSPNEAAGRRRAEEFRKEHDLGLAAVKDVFELVHSTTGIDVLSMDAGDEEHGLSMRDPATGRTVIAVATTGNPLRQRTSIAHELGHVLAGDLDRPAGGAPGERTPAEKQADTFARHLLIPLDAVGARVAPGQATVAALSALVQEFEVSPHVAAIQLKETGLIDPDTCQEWSRLTAPMLAAEHGWLSQYRSLVADSTQPRAPQQLMARAVAGYHRGVIGLTELALWYRQEPDELAPELGVPAASEDDVDSDDVWDIDAPLFPPPAL